MWPRKTTQDPEWGAGEIGWMNINENGYKCQVLEAEKRELESAIRISQELASLESCFLCGRQQNSPSPKETGKNCLPCVMNWKISHTRHTQKRRKIGIHTTFCMCYVLWRCIGPSPDFKYHYKAGVSIKTLTLKPLPSQGSLLEPTLEPMLKCPIGEFLQPRYMRWPCKVKKGEKILVKCSPRQKKKNHKSDNEQRYCEGAPLDRRRERN